MVWRPVFSYARAYCSGSTTPTQSSIWWLLAPLIGVFFLSLVCTSWLLSISTWAGSSSIDSMRLEICRSKCRWKLGRGSFAVPCSANPSNEHGNEWTIGKFMHHPWLFGSQSPMTKKKHNGNPSTAPATIAWNSYPPKKHSWFPSPSNPLWATNRKPMTSQIITYQHETSLNPTYPHTCGSWLTGVAFREVSTWQWQGFFVDPKMQREHLNEAAESLKEKHMDFVFSITICGATLPWWLIEDPASFWVF